MQVDAKQSILIAFAEEIMPYINIKDIEIDSIFTESTKSTTYDTIKFVCTEFCNSIFGDSVAQLKRKNNNDYLILTQFNDFYKIYDFDEILYTNKNLSVSLN